MSKAYYLYTQTPGEEVWHWNAIASFPDHVYDDKTIWYMSHRCLRYKVEERDRVTEELLKTIIFEPEETLARKWDEYVKNSQ